MATEETVKEVVKQLFLSPLAFKPKPQEGQEVKVFYQKTTQIFMATLQDIPDDLLIAATVHYIASNREFPAVADLRKAAVYLVNRADDVPDPSTAWGQVKRAVRTRDPLHPLAEKAINSLGGLRDFGQSDLGDEGQWRARFIMAYEGYLKRQVEDAMMLPQIAGYIEKRRELNGNSVAGLIEATAERLRK